MCCREVPPVSLVEYSFVAKQFSVTAHILALAKERAKYGVEYTTELLEKYICLYQVFVVVF